MFLKRFSTESLLFLNISLEPWRYAFAGTAHCTDATSLILSGALSMPWPTRAPAVSSHHCRSTTLIPNSSYGVFAHASSRVARSSSGVTEGSGRFHRSVAGLHGSPEGPGGSMERLLQKIPQGCAGLGKVVGLYRENTSEVPGSGCWIEFWSGPWLRGFRVSASHKVGRHRSMTRPALERSVVQTSGVTSVLVEEMFFFLPAC